MLRMGASAAAPIPAHWPRTPIRGRRSHRSRHSCRRSCGARLHFVRHCLAQCAPQRRPLTRRGGCPPPGSPASISRPPVQRQSGFRPAMAGLGGHTPRIDDAGVPSGIRLCAFGVLGGHRGACGCWSERVSVRYTRIVILLSPRDPACHPPIHGRHTPEHGMNTDRYTTGTRGRCAIFTFSGPIFRRHAPVPMTLALRSDEAGPD